MSVTVVTSFGPAQWEEYAKNFVDTYVRHWPNNHKLVCYYEHDEPAIKQGMSKPNVVFKDLYEVPNVEPFLARTSVDHFKGLFIGKDSGELKYNFRLDVNKFSRKCFAAYAAYVDILEEPRQGTERRLLVWADADIVTFADIPQVFINSLLPEEAALAYLGREHINTYPETGFWVIDVDHSQTNAFMQLLWNFYQSGAFPFLKEWHDCYVLEMTRRLTNIPCHNLSPENIQDLHVFIHSPMGTYMDHLKGPNRKTQGYSPEHPHYDEAGRASAGSA